MDLLSKSSEVLEKQDLVRRPVSKVGFQGKFGCTYDFDRFCELL